MGVCAGSRLPVSFDVEACCCNYLNLELQHVSEGYPRIRTEHEYESENIIH